MKNAVVRDREGILVSEMSSESDPILYATQENATAEPPRTELSEIDKILIQDKLDERGRVRHALTETFRYATIAATGILSYFVGANFAGAKSMKGLDVSTFASPIPFLLVLAALVLALAGSRTAHFVKRLEILNKELNTALSLFSRSVDDSDLTELAKKQWLKPLWIWIAFLAVVLLAISFHQVLLSIRQLLQ